MKNGRRVSAGTGSSFWEKERFIQKRKIVYGYMIDIFEFEPSTVAKFATTTRQGAIESKRESHLTEYYNFDMIILVSYRVKSKRRVEFWQLIYKAPLN